MIKTFEYSYNDDHEDLSGVVMVVMIKQKQTIIITLEKFDNDRHSSITCTVHCVRNWDRGCQR